MESADVILVADVGKSRCRVELRRGVEVLGSADQQGFPGLGMDNGARFAFELLADTAAMLPGGIPSSLRGIGAGCGESGPPSPGLRLPQQTHRNLLPCLPNASTPPQRSSRMPPPPSSEP